MKRLISTLAAVALGVVLAPSSFAATTVQGGPLTGLSFDAPTKIHLVFTNYPTAHGLYVLEAVKPAAGARPTTTNAATQLWLSSDTSQGASSIKGDVVLTVDNGHSWGADCAHQEILQKINLFRSHLLLQQLHRLQHQVHLQPLLLCRQIPSQYQ
jgi:hypothetical protein